MKSGYDGGKAVRQQTEPIWVNTCFTYIIYIINKTL